MFLDGSAAVVVALGVTITQGEIGRIVRHRVFAKYIEAHVAQAKVLVHRYLVGYVAQ